jgi:translation initiation factor 2 alpha subunit (eIF-2alpha)
METKTCDESVPERGRWGGFHSHACGRKIWNEHPEEGKCKIHHSISREERLKKSEEHWKAKEKKSPEYRLKIEIENWKAQKQILEEKIRKLEESVEYWRGVANGKLKQRRKSNE